MRAIIEKFIIQKAADHNCLLDCWNISCHRQFDLSLRTKDFVLSYVMRSLEEAVLDLRFAQLDQAAVEELLKRDNLPVRSECDVLRIALMYYFRHEGHVNMQSLLNVIRYNCGNETLMRIMRSRAFVSKKIALMDCGKVSVIYTIRIYGL
ncbi:BTB And C-terminal Kelch family protein [Brugia pahangi]